MPIQRNARERKCKIRLVSAVPNESWANPTTVSIAPSLRPPAIHAMPLKRCVRSEDVDSKFCRAINTFVMRIKARQKLIAWNAVKSASVILVKKVQRVWSVSLLKPMATVGRPLKDKTTGYLRTHGGDEREILTTTRDANERRDTIEGNDRGNKNG